MADTLRILYVDDEPGLLEIGKLFLEREGAFTIDTLTSARQALEQVKTERYDAIISDYQMPEIDGIAFLKHLKASGNTTPFIIFTGRGREEVIIEAFNNGADFYLQKGGEPKSQFAELSHKIQTAVTRKRTEKRAKDTERRLYDIINFLPDATFAIDNEGTIIAWNRAMEVMTGAKSSEIVGKDNYEYALAFYNERRPMLIDLVLAPDKQFENDKYLYTSHDSTILTAETILEKPDGSRIHLWGKASLLFDEIGNLAGAIESIRDITERKKADDELRAAYGQMAAAEEELRAAYEQLTAQEEELRAQYDMLALNEAEWESTFNAISDWITLITPEGRILRTNKAAEPLFGTPVGQVLGLNCFELVHGAECLKDDCPRKRMLVSKKRETTEIPMQDGNGWLQVTVDPILNSAGEVVSAVHIVRDISERMRSQKAMVQAKKKLNLLNYVTFSDIQNMIFSLSGYQHLAKERVSEQPASTILGKQEEILQKISLSLKFAQSFQDLGLKPPRWQNVNQVFLMAISHLDFLKIRHTVQLDGLEVFTDPLLEQVFHILADNILTHGKTATQVTFRYDMQPESVILFFEDDGSGIAGETKEKIFLPDFQKKKGVGLFLAREILDITGITIRETGEPGKGARFEMTVPKGMYRFTGTDKRDLP